MNTFDSIRKSKGTFESYCTSTFESTPVFNIGNYIYIYIYATSKRQSVNQTSASCHILYLRTCLILQRWLPC